MPCADEVPSSRRCVGTWMALTVMFGTALGRTSSLDAEAAMRVLVPDELEAWPNRISAALAASLRDMLQKVV